MPSEASRRMILISAGGGLIVALTGCSGVLAENPPREGPDPFYIENFDNREHEFTLKVVRDRDGEEVVDGRYRIPANHGTSVSGVGELGETYRVAVSIDDLPPLTREWRVSECPAGARGSKANMAGAFFARKDSMGFAQNRCSDQQAGYSSEPTYVSPSEVAINEDSP